MNLFNYQEKMDDLGWAYYSELTGVLSLRLNEVRFAADSRSEKQLLAIQEEQSSLFRKRQQMEASHYISELYRLLVRAWSIPVKGRPSSWLYSQPMEPIEVLPRFTKRLDKKPLKEIDWPPEVFTVFSVSNRNDSLFRGTVFRCKKEGRWYSYIDLWDRKKEKRLFQVKRIYSQIHVFPGEWWTRESYNKAKIDKMIYINRGSSPINHLHLWGRDVAMDKWEHLDIAL